MDWAQSIGICNKLGNGSLAELKSLTDMELTLSLFKNMRSLCQNIWTPLTDEEVEGHFKNAITGDLVAFLPWWDNNPNGLHDENYVLLSMTEKAYFDVVQRTKWPSCAVCDINIKTQLSQSNSTSTGVGD